MYDLFSVNIVSMSILMTRVFRYFQAKRNYEKKNSEAERALEGYRRADADINLSRAEVEKVGADNMFRALSLFPVFFLNNECFEFSAKRHFNVQYQFKTVLNALNKGCHCVCVHIL